MKEAQVAANKLRDDVISMKMKLSKLAADYVAEMERS